MYECNRGCSEILNDGSCKEGQHNLMMAGDGEAFTSALGGSTDHICARPVMLNEVHVDRSEMLERKSEVPCERHGLEKDFGKKHGRSHIKVHAAL